MADLNNIDVEREMRSILSIILNKPPEEIMPDSRFIEDLGMDSILAVEILAAIEKKFKIAIPDDEIKKVASLKQAVALAEHYIAENIKKKGHK